MVGDVAWSTVISDLSALVARLRGITVELQTTERISGAGVIWRADGLVVTSAHVVASGHGASSPRVVMADRRPLPAILVGCDRQRDLALLRVAARDLPAATVGD